MFEEMELWFESNLVKGFGLLLWISRLTLDQDLEQFLVISGGGSR